MEETRLAEIEHVLDVYPELVPADPDYVRNACRELLAEVRRLRGEIAEVKRIGNEAIAHEQTLRGHSCPHCKRRPGAYCGECLGHVLGALAPFALAAEKCGNGANAAPVVAAHGLTVGDLRRAWKAKCGEFG